MMEDQRVHFGVPPEMTVGAGSEGGFVHSLGVKGQTCFDSAPIVVDASGSF